MEKKYLDYEGLKTLVDKIKEMGPGGGGGGLPLVTEMPSNPNPGDMVCWGGEDTSSYKKGALYEWVPPIEEEVTYYCYEVGSPESPTYIYLDIEYPEVDAPIYDVWDKTQNPPVEVTGPATDVSEIDLIPDSDYNYVAGVDTSVEPITITFGPIGNDITATRDDSNDISGTVSHPGYWKEIIIQDCVQVVTSIPENANHEDITILYLGQDTNKFKSGHIYHYDGDKNIIINVSATGTAMNHYAWFAASYLDTLPAITDDWVINSVRDVQALQQAIRLGQTVEKMVLDDVNHNYFSYGIAVNDGVFPPEPQFYIKWNSGQDNATPATYNLTLLIAGTYTWTDITEEILNSLLETKNDKFQYDELPSIIEMGSVIQDKTNGNFFKGAIVSQKRTFSTIFELKSWISENGTPINLLNRIGESASRPSISMELDGNLCQFVILPNDDGVGYFQNPEFGLSVYENELTTLIYTDTQVQDLGELTHEISFINLIYTLDNVLNNSPLSVFVTEGVYTQSCPYAMLSGYKSDGTRYTDQFIHSSVSGRYGFIETDTPLSTIDSSDSRIVWLNGGELPNYHIMYYPYGTEWKLLSPEPIPTNNVEAFFHGPDWTPEP